MPGQKVRPTIERDSSWFPHIEILSEHARAPAIGPLSRSWTQSRSLRPGWPAVSPQSPTQRVKAPVLRYRPIYTRRAELTELQLCAYPSNSAERATCARSTAQPAETDENAHRHSYFPMPRHKDQGKGGVRGSDRQRRRLAVAADIEPVARAPPRR